MKQYYLHKSAEGQGNDRHLNSNVISKEHGKDITLTLDWSNTLNDTDRLINRRHDELKIQDDYSLLVLHISG